MRRILAALGLSLALAAAPASAQVVFPDQQAPQRDNAAVAAIAALIALGVIGAIASDDDDDDDRPARHRGHDDWDWDRGHDDEYRDGRVLTAECVRHVRGGQRVLAGECLHRHGYRARLPEQCRSWVRAGGRDRPVYDMRCLRGSGYHVR
jgi:hypothetical protein